MFTFHKPKVFRSANGCCICKAKSSSSRFTDSQRYEPVFERCFLLDELRSGEICNACVLLVKRFQKLPKSSKKDWSHVVDARSGPGIKTGKGKHIRNNNNNNSKSSSNNNNNNNNEDLVDTPEKVLKKKHVYRRKKQLNPVRREKQPEPDISTFLDKNFWKKEEICCGTIFRGTYGEVVLDTRFLRPCACRMGIIAATKNNNNDLKNKTIDTDSDRDDELFIDEDSEPETETSFQRAARKLSEQAAADKSEAGPSTSTRMEVDDEGFFDRPAVSPNSSNGESVTPPPVLDIELEIDDDEEDSGGSSADSSA